MQNKEIKPRFEVGQEVWVKAETIKDGIVVGYKNYGPILTYQIAKKDTGIWFGDYGSARVFLTKQEAEEAVCKTKKN